MTPPPAQVPMRNRKSASPAERSVEFAEAQQRLKREAAERRQKAADQAAEAPPSAPPARGRRTPDRS